MEPIISRALIARQADRAAQLWAQTPNAPEPQNPYDQHLQPDAFRCWQCDFRRYQVQHLAPESEASA
jgi:hypothetical protein